MNQILIFFLTAIIPTVCNALEIVAIGHTSPFGARGEDRLRYQEEIDRIKPAAILLGGDLAYNMRDWRPNDWEPAFAYSEEWIRSLRREYPVYSVYGNSDYDPQGIRFPNFADIVARMHADFGPPYWEQEIGNFSVVGLDSMDCADEFPHKGCYPRQAQQDFLSNAFERIRTSNVAGAIIITHHIFWYRSFYDKHHCDTDKQSMMCKLLLETGKRSINGYILWPLHDPNLPNPWADDIHLKLAQLVQNGKQVVVIGGDSSFNGYWKVDGVDYYSTGYRSFTWQPFEQDTIDYLLLRLNNRIEVEARSIPRIIEVR